ncbi:MAG: 50S ribosomal protein L6 [Chloroflexi bacterium]|nr:50S ribosomal protein L6 [Chloroflexota bacterium]
MSRIGRMPVPVPKGVQVEVKDNTVRVKGPKGELSRVFPTAVAIEMKDGVVVVSRGSDERRVRALHGTARALINNMVVGVSTGFSKTLQIEGVGYRAEKKGKDLILSLGFSHPVPIPPPPGIEFTVDEKAKTFTISGYDREQVGQVTADIRKLRPPEPYKGKGLRFVGERIRRKAGKAGKVG